ncbi:ARM repeat-containing protein [Trametes cingulata]|nr:ARM repeat-containing protein [Trametes cingulata]
MPLPASLALPHIFKIGTDALSPALTLPSTASSSRLCLTVVPSTPHRQHLRVRWTLAAVRLPSAGVDVPDSSAHDDNSRALPRRDSLQHDEGAVDPRRVKPFSADGSGSGSTRSPSRASRAPTEAPATPFSAASLGQCSPRAYKSRVRAIELVWCVQDPNALPPMIPLFSSLLAQSQNAYATLRISVFYTRVPASPDAVRAYRLPPGLTLSPARPKLPAILQGINTVFAVYSIYREFEHLIPDAPELLQTFLAAESDATCKRNAFVFLAHCAMPKAVEYILQVFDQIPSMDEHLQMSIIEVIRLDCKQETTHKARYILLISELLNASSHAVKHKAATTLTSLTQNPTAVKAAASCYINLVQKESDNNAKLIVLDRLDALRSKHGHVLDPLIMDILQILSSADLEVWRKALSIVLSLTSSRNVEEVILFLKKQLQKTQDQEYEKAPEYRQLLIQSIHVCAVKFSEVAASVVHALMDFLGDSNNPSALDVVAFVREVVEKFPQLRRTICDKLIQTLPEIKSGKVYCGVLWILGEYAEDVQEIQEVFRQLRKVLGEIPILASEQRLLEEASAEDGEEKKDEQVKTETSKPKVLADGTYATESAFTSVSSARLEAVKAAAKPLGHTGIVDCSAALFSGHKERRRGGGALTGIIVGVCGPQGLGDEVCKAVANFPPQRRKAVGGIELHEEAFGW